VLVTLPQTGWQFTPEAPEIRVPYAKAGGNMVWLAPERLSNSRWWMIGPFPYDDHKGFFAEYPPEREFTASAEYPGAYGRAVRWKWIESPTYFVDVRNALSIPRNRALGVFYALAHVYSPSARKGRLSAAFADSLAVWWNGEQKLLEHRHPKWLLMRDVWAEKRDIEIRQGWNMVLLKIGSSLMVPTAFLFRIEDERGRTMRDLVYADQIRASVEPHPRTADFSVAVPPGTANQSAKEISYRGQPIPEQPVAFRSATVEFTLQSWTDSALAHYSGTAIYETQFRLEKADAGNQLSLDLGSVGVAAEVWVNGRKAGERVWRPYRFDITGLVRSGLNQLRIRVANSDAGWQSQGDTIYPKGSWGLRYETELDRLKTIRPNGLEGPVRIFAR
jgi:hypothetical protein